MTTASTSGWAYLNTTLPALNLSTIESRTAHLKLQLLNDGSQEVLFDSVTIRHPQSGLLVSQEQHYYPFGLSMTGVAINTLPAEAISKAQNNGGSQLEDELLGEAANYTTTFRQYDPTLGRFLAVDPLAGEFSEHSPFNFATNDPVYYNDPDGAEPAIYRNGRQINPRNVYGQREFEGSAMDWDAYNSAINGYFAPGVHSGDPFGGSVERDAARSVGGYYVNGEIRIKIVTKTKDRDTGKETIRNEYSQNIQGDWATTLSWTVLRGIAIDATIVDPSDAVPQKWVAEAVVGAVAVGVLYKKLPKTGIQYTLRATHTGFYPVYDWGRKNPVGMTFLPEGATWKIGETMQWNPIEQSTKRYPQVWLRATGLRLQPEYYGNQVDIKMKEQMELMNYLFNYGDLPPGNKGWK
ncbi:hypothetical protein E5K00_08065 [Hymenobacter aquaticus]|uniref:RHS repeat-associated core domain-containing protein n=1 Tax=Hymenobacter aquaticus TaxID=1867101 RepID=A0A4Z0Q7U7_9BACT|nr:RHS repeat-associated core domain-containing protein [Hymenobacter aquaticus]TGE25141.1 hypothetical protein E5K00_08065 [Hymenobacter aquaticus]